MSDMPHASGKSVDVALWDPQENKEVYMRDSKDDPDALFLDFYRDKTDEQSRYFQKLQDFVVQTMRSNGFDIGKKNEYFPF